MYVCTSCLSVLQRNFPYIDYPDACMYVRTYIHVGVPNVVIINMLAVCRD